MQVWLVERSSAIPTVDGEDTVEVHSQEKTPPKSIGLPPMLLVGLLRTWLPTDSAKDAWCKLPMPLVLPSPWAFMLIVMVQLSMVILTLILGFTDHDLQLILFRNFDLRPGMIIKELNLKRPIYKKTASGGHFGRNDDDFTWEKIKDLSHEKKKPTEVKSEEPVATEEKKEWCSSSVIKLYLLVLNKGVNISVSKVIINI